MLPLRCRQATVSKRSLTLNLNCCRRLQPRRALWKLPWECKLPQATVCLAVRDNVVIAARLALRNLIRMKVAFIAAVLAAAMLCSAGEQALLKQRVAISRTFTAANVRKVPWILSNTYSFVPKLGSGTSSASLLIL